MDRECDVAERDLREHRVPVSALQGVRRLNAFDLGALAPGVTVQGLDYRILSLDAGMRYKGLFLQTEICHRWLNDFAADGLLPVMTSQIFYKDAGFRHSDEYGGGFNFYPVDTLSAALSVFF